MHSIHPLPVLLAPEDRESAAGFLARTSRANGITIAGLWSHLGLGYRAAFSSVHAEVFAWASQVSPGWMAWRIPRQVRHEGQAISELFGQRFGDSRWIRSRRVQLCSLCVRSGLPLLLEWDVSFYCACPTHRVVLTDCCPHCGHSVDLFRPAPDVCSCGHYLTASQAAPPANPLALEWCKWLSYVLSPSGSEPPALPKGERPAVPS
jgi:hypothetical protein